MEELANNMEENEKDNESAKEEVKLGRLQFKIDYDFNQANVSCILFVLVLCLLLQFILAISHINSLGYVSLRTV